MGRVRYQLAAVAAVSSLLVGCTQSESPPATHSSSAPASASATAPAAPVAASVARTSAQLEGGGAVTVQAAELTEPQSAALQAVASFSGLSVASGEPVQIDAPGGLAGGRVTISRTYEQPLPEGVAATLAYFDEEEQAWVPVASELSADRRRVTASVDHLSLWNDIVGTVEDGLLSASDWLYYEVGKVADTRVDPPECEDGAPDWVSSVQFIETQRNNPVLFCAGHDAKDPELLVLKARVNRGFALQAQSSVKPEWTYNSSGQAKDIADLRASLADLGSTFADSYARLSGDGDMVAPGEEWSAGFTRASVESAEDPLLRLDTPDPAGFLISSVGQGLGTVLDSKAQGYAAAAVMLAGCTQDLSDADDPATFAAAAAGCVLTLGEEDVAKNLAVFLLERGVANPARVAVQAVRKAQTGLALIGPAFNTGNYLAELAQDPAARRVSVIVDDSVPRTDFRDFAGTWKGAIDQPSSPPYSVRLKLRANGTGTVSYPELGCSGTISEPAQDEPGVLRVTEEITKDPKRTCKSVVRLTLELKGRRLAYGALTATGRLTRSG